MKLRFGIAALVLGIFSSCAIAQAPAGAPAGTTGQCNDGSFTSTASKKGACKGHQGVKAWYATTSTSPSTATSATPPAAAPTAGPASSPAASRTQTTQGTSNNKTSPAPGGGPGLVWVNTGSNVYHCPGTKYYGTTKTGKYMTEAQAKAAGAHPDHGKACGGQ